MTGADPRADRIARNEALFRDVNERIRDLSEEAGRELVEFLCECGDDDCVERIALTPAEYERVRADPVLFAVAAGHVVPQVERVVAANERFETVRKLPGEQAIARQTSPR
jgi:hypothetical protein